ncbi:ABC transporter ATP-binding protein [Pseudonocardia sp. KRD291]|uniref:ABC transporter ATP-binding protein n=1 Tax=Pseudonocardia sp. KRD291 TaxID=2792007 RepID=UPI0027E2E0EF|nr:ABC transporter ATP-binding protein [Pseudonocardia sp. KRD291]
MTKTFTRRGGADVPAVDDLDLDIGHGEFLVLLGPSGCGKTTLLRCLAGLETPSRGEITIGGRAVFRAGRGARVDVAPEARPVSMMFQSYALWPHMTALANVAYPLENRRGGRREARAAADRALALVGVPELAEQYPGQMSGGQQQRIALARALVAGQDVVLFDEPLSNVDAKVRDQLRFELLALQRRLGFTAVYVTHDQHEAMSLATRIAVLHAGRIEQLGTPEEIYNRPASGYVARFVGVSNELTGQALDPTTVQTDIGEVTARVPTALVGHPVLLASRPERWRIVTGTPDEPNTWPATVDLAVFVGSRSEYMLGVGDGTRLAVWDSGATSHTTGSRCRVTIDPADVRVLPVDEGADEGSSWS